MKASKNDQTIRTALLRQGTVHPAEYQGKARDAKASQAQAIAARRAEMGKKS